MRVRNSIHVIAITPFRKRELTAYTHTQYVSASMCSDIIIQQSCLSVNAKRIAFRLCVYNQRASSIITKFSSNSPYSRLQSVTYYDIIIRYAAYALTQWLKNIFYKQTYNFKEDSLCAESSDTLVTEIVLTF